MTAQRHPHPGSVDVTPVARATFLRMLLERESMGIATYGTTLQAGNGRDAIRDLLEELIDGWQYAVQAQIEREGLELRYRASLAEIARLRTRLEGTP